MALDVWRRLFGVQEGQKAGSSLTRAYAERMPAICRGDIGQTRRAYFGVFSGSVTVPRASSSTSTARGP